MSRPLRVGIAGAGWGVRVQLPAFRYAGLEVTALCSRNPEQVKKLCEEHKIGFGTTKFEELVAREDVDIISIVVPPKFHLPYLKQALKAGKHVLVEKPLAMDAKEVEEMIAARKEAEEEAKKAGRPAPVCIIDHELRSWSSLQKARELVADADKFGKLLSAHVSYAGGGRMVLSPQFTWWNDKTQFGGVLGALGSHLIDTLYFITGKKIEGVSAVLNTAYADKVNEKGEPVKATSDDITALRGKIEGGAHFDMYMNMAALGISKGEFILVGTRGTVVWDMNAMKTTYYDGRSAEPKVETYEAENVPGPDFPTFRGPFSLATPLLGKQLAKAIIDGDRSAISVYATLEDGLYTQKVMDAARKSSENNGAYLAI